MDKHGYDPDSKPTHSVPKALVEKLVEAKDWYDRREALEEAILASPGYAERNQEDRDALDREAAPLLAEIIQIINETWGFARREWSS